MDLACLNTLLFSQYDVLKCLTELLRNLALLEWSRYQGKVPSLFLASHAGGEEEEAEEEEVNPQETMRMLVKYIDHIILLTLEVVILP